MEKEGHWKPTRLEGLSPPCEEDDNFGLPRAEDIDSNPAVFERIQGSRQPGVNIDLLPAEGDESPPETEPDCIPKSAIRATFCLFGDSITQQGFAVETSGWASLLANEFIRKVRDEVR